MRIHDSLMARLDRLESVRRVAQTGAAIGREFSYALMCAVTRLPEDELQAALARLVASELVFQCGTPPDAVYAFKHALVQDVAHGSLLRGARQQLHAQIAEALERHSPELLDSQPELLAQDECEPRHSPHIVGWLRPPRVRRRRSRARVQSGVRSLLTDAERPRSPSADLVGAVACSRTGAPLTLV
jgi:hypothetical protein